jgi:hypothetical protein
VILDPRIAFRSIKCKLAYYALPECWRNFSSWLNERVGATTLLTDSQQKSDASTHTLTHAHHNATALRQLLSTVPHLHVCAPRLLPPTPDSHQHRLTNSWSQQVDAGQTSDASHWTHLRLSWMTSQYRENANLSSEVSMLDICSFVSKTLYALCLAGCAERSQAVTGLSVFTTTSSKTKKFLWKRMNLLHYYLLYIGVIVFVIYPSKKKTTCLKMTTNRD